MKDVNIKAMSISTMLTVVLIFLITIYTELNSGFKDALKAFAGHHWVAKGIIAFVFFIVAYYVLNHFVSKKEDVLENVELVLVFTVVCSVGIFLFYLYEFFI